VKERLLRPDKLGLAMTTEGKEELDSRCTGMTEEIKKRLPRKLA